MEHDRNEVPLHLGLNQDVGLATTCKLRLRYTHL